MHVICFVRSFYYYLLFVICVFVIDRFIHVCSYYVVSFFMFVVISLCMSLCISLFSYVFSSFLRYVGRTCVSLLFSYVVVVVVVVYVFIFFVRSFFL